jgi:pilus assembly protein Flp/PilA
MRNFLNRLMTEEEGATMVEYALMVALIAAVAIAGATVIGTSTQTTFNSVAGKITAP